MRTQSIKNGRFIRTRKEPWTPARWNDGYVDNRGRFRVYRPDYPRVYALGYALRAHVVWWLHYGKVHPVGTNLHHMDDNKLNDALENLQLIEHGEHVRHHHLDRVEVTCLRCGKKFMTQKGRPKNGRGRYCSRFCVVNRVRVGSRYKRIFFRNKCLLLSEWSREIGIPYSVLQGRQRLGWTPEEMFTIPVNHKTKLAVS